ncbi:MAG: hypothetical protein JXB39_02065 [Deltaproteobacteria bacterium]|nr:hypothetical protein [Deltaproteobacteria bacterium]
MRTPVLLFVPLILACTSEDDTGQPPFAPSWDEEAAEVACAYGTDAALLDAALADAGLGFEEVGYDSDDWAKASYREWLDDAFLLSWFRDLHWTPLRWPCMGGQIAADLDHAAATPHPVATALGEAMAVLGTERLALPLDPATTTQDLADLSGLPEALAEALVPILAAMEEVARVRTEMEGTLEAQVEGASVEELVDYGHGGVILDYQDAPDLSSDAVQAWILDPSGPRALQDPARVLAFAVEEADLARFADLDATLDVTTPLGRVFVAGPGDDAPGDIGDVAFYLDLGGNDTYVHPAGASSAAVPVSVHVDLGGNDTYGYVESDEGGDGLLPADGDGRYGGDEYYGAFSLSRTGRQGSGRFGVGLLFDLGSGDDRYTSLRMSQGWGHLGVGVLYDDGGSDVYRGEAGVQGASSMGIGLLLDVAGNDVHETFTQSQGFGYVQAVGMAWDGQGDDVWYADPGNPEYGGHLVYYSPQMPTTGNSTFCQGAGFGRRGDADGAFLSGGVGVLRDASGDDAYTASTFAQGAGYWQGVGFLLDGRGSDTYDAYWYVQGGAAHYAAGVLLDDGDGDDAFNTRMAPVYVMIGTGHDYSDGVLVNEAGDDTYTYAGLGGGASNCQGVGIFVDNDGADTYDVQSTYSTGLGNHSGECDAFPRNAVDSIGLFLDSGGDADTWQWPGGGDHPIPADDTTFGHAQSGDTEEKGGGVDGDGETGVHAAGALPAAR